MNELEFLDKLDKLVIVGVSVQEIKDAIKEERKNVFKQEVLSVFHEIYDENDFSSKYVFVATIEHTHDQIEFINKYWDCIDEIMSILNDHRKEKEKSL